MANVVEHAAGWRILLDTDVGVVGLWSCWLKNKFLLAYTPKYDTFPAERVKSILQVEDAKPVLKLYSPPKKWAPYYAPRQAGTLGRVWVSDTYKGVISESFHHITQDGALKEIILGTHLSKNIATYPYTFCNERNPDAPSTAPELVQPYRDRFFELSIEVARFLGNLQSVTIKYVNTEGVDELSDKGYSDIVRCDNGSNLDAQLFRAQKDTESGREFVYLRIGNPPMPWSAIRRVPCSNELKVTDLRQLLIF